MRVGHRARGARSRAGIPLTSMIDATFLLLTYFLFTTGVVLPEERLAAEARAVAEASGASGLAPQVVELFAVPEGIRYRIGPRVCATRQELAAVLRELPKEPGVVLSVRPGPPVEAVAGMMQAAHDAGFSRISYVGAH